MAEKNILVNRGIPPGTSTPANFLHFGTGWKNFSSATGMSWGSSVGLTTTTLINGAPTSGGYAIAQIPFYLMQTALEESLGEGNGWLPYDSYTDLGMDFWDTIPLQLFEIRQEMAGKMDDVRNKQLSTLKSELDAAGVSYNSINIINQSLKYVQQKLSQWENTLATSIAKIMHYPAKDYLSRTISEIIADLKKINEYDAPPAIDKELQAFKDACEAANNMAIRDALVVENANLVDSRSLLQAIEQAKKMAQLDAQQQAQNLAEQPLFDMAYLSDKEGGVQTTAYVPMDHGVPADQSGATLGAGVDLGSKTPASLLNDGISQSLVSILGEYSGLRGQQALNKLQQKPLSISEAQAKELTNIYFGVISSAVETRFNNTAGAGKFRNIPFNTRTAIIDLSFQYGDNLAARAPITWGKIVSGDWSGVIQELNNFGDAYPTRRKSEAKLIQGDIDRDLFK
ncbi:pesticin C-terminus-like muramidase [Pseudomonas sp. XS1P51]